MDFERDKAIDPFGLEEEWLRQPSLADEYGRIVAEAQRKYDDAKLELDICKSKIELEIRENPEGDRFKKLTEALIASLVMEDIDVIKLSREMNKAREELGYAQAALRAIRHKKTALEYAVKLLEMNYYSGPECKELKPGVRGMKEIKEGEKATKKAMQRRKQK